MVMILDAFVPRFAGLLAQMVNDEVGMLLDIPGEIEKLEQTVGDIQAVLADAEKKQTESESVKRWLLELKDVMYDADDIMDLCQYKYEERRDRLDSPSFSNFSCGCFHVFSCFRNPAFAHEIGTKIKEINAKLEEIAKRRTALGLIGTQVVVPPSHFRRLDSCIHCKTDSSVVMDDLVGDKIEEEAKLLVSWLTDEEKGDKRNILVMAIYGMGGIGKTTLAKRIFNDPRVEEEFKQKIWLCVSKDVKGAELLKSIIQQMGGDVGVAEERQVMVFKLQEAIKGKKFFLVLDDIWPESLSVWDDLLRNAMNGGSPGSKLLVTTRDERVVRGVNATKSHRVGKLSDQDGWLLLKKQVFQNEKVSEIEEFKNIGFELVRKCDGLPLAIKSIGGVLRTKSKKTVQWKAILRNNVWFMNGLPQDIHRALYLSFEDLPSPLKQCFIICSLYPEDYEFDKIELIYHWIAEGLLQVIENQWEQGVEYYNELLLRNLLEGLSWEGKSKMHDILWSFARHLGKDESCILIKGQVLNRQGCTVKLRRFSTREANVDLEDVYKENGLRTLFVEQVPENTLTSLCTTLSNLRILVLKDSKFSTLPNCLSILVHLRYLDVSHSKITTIPKSLGLLKNIVYLNFSRCYQLKHVPHNITNLKKLMYLSFVNSRVEGIPSGLKNFVNLTHLYGFKPGNNNLNGLSGLEELETLLHLVTLQIRDLENVSDISTVTRAKLCCKEQLQYLYLFFSSKDEEDQVSQSKEKKVTTESVLKELCPPHSLESLNIDGYFGNTLPNWFNFRANLPNLRELSIFDCHCLESLAPFGQLPNLEVLKIIDACSIVTVGEEFLWGDTTRGNCFIIPAFPKLTDLVFDGLQNWKEWKWNKGLSAMPKLKELSIYSCPELKSLPKGLSHHATSLEDLEIQSVDNLTLVENLSFVKNIHVRENKNLERISNLSNVLSSIKIRFCPNLKNVEVKSVSSIAIEECRNLKTVEVENLSALQLNDILMKTLPEFLMTTTPSKLTIGCSEELWRQITSQGENGSEWHKFKHIPNVTIYCYAWVNRNYMVLNAIYETMPFSFTTNVSEISWDA